MLYYSSLFFPSLYSFITSCAMQYIIMSIAILARIPAMYEQILQLNTEAKITKIDAMKNVIAIKIAAFIDAYFYSLGKVPDIRDFA